MPTHLEVRALNVNTHHHRGFSQIAPTAIARTGLHPTVMESRVGMIFASPLGTSHCRHLSVISEAMGDGYLDEFSDGCPLDA